MEIVWVRQCPLFRLTFNISSLVAVKQLSQSACTTFKLSLLDIHKIDTEFYGHATKFLVAYMTENGIGLVCKLNYLFLYARTKHKGQPGWLSRYRYLVKDWTSEDLWFDLQKGQQRHWDCTKYSVTVPRSNANETKSSPILSI